MSLPLHAILNRSTIEYTNEFINLLLSEIEKNFLLIVNHWSLSLTSLQSFWLLELNLWFLYIGISLQSMNGIHLILLWRPVNHQRQWVLLILKFKVGEEWQKILKKNKSNPPSKLKLSLMGFVIISSKRTHTYHKKKQCYCQRQTKRNC